MADPSPDRKELKAGWKHETEVKTLTKEDVAKHKTKKDIWITIHGRVYDVTAYLADHPGGPDALLEVAGQDATTAYEDVGHSDDAGEIMQTYLVGQLEGASPGAPKSAAAPAKPSVQIVRKPEEPAKAASTPELLALLRSPQAGIAILAVGGLTGLVYAVKLLGHGGGFMQGFLTASVGFGAVVVLSTQYFSKLTKSFTPPFESYPAHIKSSTPRISEYHPAGVLTPTTYSKYKLRSKTEVSSQIWRFTFDLPTKYSVLGLPIGQHVAIRGTVHDSTVVRSYTPISNNRDLGRLDLLIRVYPDGQLGNFLKNLNVGDYADIRGPKGAMKYRKGLCREIGMVAGGTGLTPMYQLIRAICEDPTDKTKVSLVYGNRSETDIMLREELDGYAKSTPEKFRIFYILDHPGPNWKGGKGYVTADILSEYMPKPAADTKVLLCGPPPMVNAAKKALVGTLGFEPPGAVSKLSDQVFCF